MPKLHSFTTANIQDNQEWNRVDMSGTKQPFSKPIQIFTLSPTKKEARKLPFITKPNQQKTSLGMFK